MANYQPCPKCGKAIMISTSRGTGSQRCPGCKKWLLIKDGKIVGLK